MQKPKPIEVLAWGIVLRTGNTSSLIGRYWHMTLGLYDGEPGRALLFSTRIAARRWINHRKMAGNRFAVEGRLSVVRVVEKAEVV